jgi:membrane protein implicated in regulation of membrane protease activity
VLFIVAIVALFVLPSPWNWVAAVVLACGGVVEIGLWNRTVKGRRRAVGPENLVGTEAVVVSPCTPQGQVRVGAEIWAAHCDAMAWVDERVRVVAVDGLVLTVERLAPGADVPAPAAPEG